MKQELDSKLVKAFPLLYGDRSAPMQSTAMCWGFACSDGWFDIIWDLSSKLEPLIQKFIDDNPNMSCSGCGCKKERHFGWKSRNPGKCLAIHVDPESEEEPPNNYFACFCNEYGSLHPKASQIKEKFGGLRFYMTCGTDEIFDLVEEAEELSYKICEECGKPGKERDGGWIHTHCDDCHENWDKIRAKIWKREEDILDDEDERLYDRLIKEIIIECHSETLDWDEDRMKARLRKVLETT
jgi:hypothetical protein